MLKLIKERPQHLVMRKRRKEKKEANYQRNVLDNDDYNWDYMNLQNVHISVMDEPCLVEIFNEGIHDN